MILERIEDWIVHYRLSEEYGRSSVKDILINVTKTYWDAINMELRRSNPSIYTVEAADKITPAPFNRAASMAFNYQGFQLIIVKGDYNFITPVILNLWSDEIFNPTYLDPSPRAVKPFFDRGPRQG